MHQNVTAFEILQWIPKSAFCALQQKLFLFISYCISCLQVCTISKK